MLLKMHQKVLMDLVAGIILLQVLLFHIEKWIIS